MPDTIQIISLPSFSPNFHFYNKKFGGEEVEFGAGLTNFISFFLPLSLLILSIN